MSKKNNRITFRTTDQNFKHLQDIQEKYDFPVSNTIHRMVEYFAKGGNVDKTVKELLR